MFFCVFFCVAPASFSVDTIKYLHVQCFSCWRTSCHLVILFRAKKLFSLLHIFHHFSTAFHYFCSCLSPISYRTQSSFLVSLRSSISFDFLIKGRFLMNVFHFVGIVAAAIAILLEILSFSFIFFHFCLTAFSSFSSFLSPTPYHANSFVPSSFCSASEYINRFRSFDF